MTDPYGNNTYYIYDDNDNRTSITTDAVTTTATYDDTNVFDTLDWPGAIISNGPPVR